MLKPISTTRSCSAALLICFTYLFVSDSLSAAEKKYWDLSPYRIEIHIAVDCTAKPQTNLDEQLLTSVRERIRSTLFPLWTTEISLAQGPQRQKFLAGLGQLSDHSIDEAALSFDKQLYLTVRATTTGYQLSCREYDCYLHRWGPVLERTVRQEIALAAQCYDLLRRAFAPLATVRALDDDKQRVSLHFKGGDLPRQTDEELFTDPGDVYLPLMVRTNSAGEITPEGVREVPWTYLTLDEPKDEDWLSQVHSGIRTPFGLRRRGRVENMAIALRHAPNSTNVRFHARHDDAQGLSGYEVFQRASADQESQLLALTDANGSVRVEPAGNPITTLFLRSDGQLLAKIPVAPGAVAEMDVPVGDDPARLRAQASLVSLREQLIDLVARRSILMTRVRDRLKKGNIAEAEELFNELDSLPGRAQFDQLISSAENNTLNRSEDARIQAKIEKLFGDTRKLLGRFLSLGEITKLKGELTTARREKQG